MQVQVSVVDLSFPDPNGCWVPVVELRAILPTGDVYSRRLNAISAFLEQEVSVEAIQAELDGWQQVASLEDPTI